jgi:SEC-C motif-containing protein
MTLCPCGSGAKYASCCRPLHRGEREAPDAEALMRSRFAAFAQREIAYLLRTLHVDHEDRRMGEPSILASLRETASAHRYMGLSILDRDGPDPDGIARVLFRAKVFHKGQDLSFVELSSFKHDGAGWRYLRGEGIPARTIGLPLEALDIPAFEARLLRPG